MAKGHFLGEFEIYVMLALAHLGPTPTASPSDRRSPPRTGREVAIGAVYATLSRLEDEGLVAYTVCRSACRCPGAVRGSTSS